MQDKFEGKSYWLGLESGIMNLSELTRNVEDSIRQVVEDERVRLSQGKFDVFYVVDVIRKSGGKSFLAHPFVYKLPNLKEFLDELDDLE